MQIQTLSMTEYWLWKTGVYTNFPSLNVGHGELVHVQTFPLCQRIENLEIFLNKITIVGHKDEKWLCEVWGVLKSVQTAKQ